LATGDAGDGQLRGDLPLGGQGVIGPEKPLLDGLAQGALQLLVERLAAPRIQGLEDFGQAGHDGDTTSQIPICKHLTKWYGSGLHW
jgi:hypothetical protein